MLKTKLLIALFLTVSISSLAQAPVLKGVLKEGETGQPLTGATVKIVSGKDSLTVLSDRNGAFEIKNFKPGIYKLVITYINFETYSSDLVLENTSKTLNDIQMNKEAKTLSGVTIVSSPPLVKQKEDTTEINASQLKVNPDANAEDLVKKAPGITVENGQVKVGGEEVRKVTVDGRDFFGDDATATLRNLPAEIVDKIQVFDRMSEQAQFTGVDDGNAAKSINIVTKVNMRSGQFGRLFGGYGTDNHYLAGGNMSYFKKDMRLSVVGLTNDVNQQNFAEVDLLGVSGGGGGFGGFRGGGGFGGRGGGGGNRGGGGFGGWGGDRGFLIGQQPGVSKTNSLGINYNDKWGKNLDVSGSYFFNGRNTANDEAVAREYFLSGDSSQFYHENSLSSNKNFNHRANFRFDWKLDSNNSILIIPSVSIQKYNSLSTVSGFNFLTETDPLSRTLNRSESERLGYNFNNNILYRHSFSKRGRTFSVNFSTRFNNQDGETYTDAYSLYYKGPANFNDTLRQFNDQLTKGTTLSANLSYTEPVGKKGAILEFRYSPSFTFNNSDRETYYMDDASGKYSRFDTSLSNVFDNTYFTQRGGVNYRIGDRERQISFGVDFQAARLESDQVFPFNTKVSRTFTNILPNAMIRMQISKKENIRIFYRGGTNEPSVNQLQEVINNTNPLFVSTGNPELKQSYNHRLGGRYQWTNSAKSKSFFLNLFGSTTSNYVTTATYIAKQDSALSPTVTLFRGSQLSKPVNLNGQWNLNTFMTYAMPLKFLKTNMNLNAGFVYNRTPGMVNNVSGLTRSYNFNTGIVLASNISQYVDFTVSYSANFNSATNSLQPELENDYFMSRGSAALNLLSKKGWLLNTDISNQSYHGLTDGFNQNYWLWNMAVAKKILKDQKGEIRFAVFDLLNQNQSITRNISEIYIEDVITQVVSQYFMLTFTYNLKNFGKAPARGNFNQMNMQNFRGDFRRN